MRSFNYIIHTSEKNDLFDFLLKENKKKKNLKLQRNISFLFFEYLFIEFCQIFNPYEIYCQKIEKLKK